MNTKMTKLALALGALVMAGGAMAATDTANLAVSATVENACAIGPGTLSFGSTLKLAVNSDGTAGTTADVDADSNTSISVICTNGASAAITGGLGANADGTTRRMKISATTDYLAYELYTSSARTTILDTTTGAIAYTGTGLATVDKAVYGRITGSALAAAKAGTYADTVALTITYTP